MLNSVAILNVSIVCVVDFFNLLVPLLSQVEITSVIECFSSLLKLLQYRIGGVLNSSPWRIVSYFSLMLYILNHFTATWMKTTVPSLNSTLISKTWSAAIVFSSNPWFTNDILCCWGSLGWTDIWVCDLNEIFYIPYIKQQHYYSKLCIILYHLWWRMILCRFPWSICFNYKYEHNHTPRKKDKYNLHVETQLS